MSIFTTVQSECAEKKVSNIFKTQDLCSPLGVLSLGGVAMNETAVPGPALMGERHWSVSNNFNVSVS